MRIKGKVKKARARHIHARPALSRSGPLRRLKPSTYTGVWTESGRLDKSNHPINVTKKISALKLFFYLMDPN